MAVTIKKIDDKSILPHFQNCHQPFFSISSSDRDKDFGCFSDSLLRWPRKKVTSSLLALQITAYWSRSTIKSLHNGCLKLPNVKDSAPEIIFSEWIKRCIKKVVLYFDWEWEPSGYGPFPIATKHMAWTYTSPVPCRRHSLRVPSAAYVLPLMLVLRSYPWVLASAEAYGRYGSFSLFGGEFEKCNC